MTKIINGIQQIGIGVADTKAVFNWYRKNLHFDILLFDDIAEASLMTAYTGNKVQRRKALLALNMAGGGGLEIWQFKDRLPAQPVHPIQMGDLGILANKIRSNDVLALHQHLSSLIKNQHDISVSEISVSVLDPKNKTFFFIDPWGNWVQVVTSNFTYVASKSSSGGVLGAVIGVRDIDTSIKFYQKLLGFDQVLSDQTDVFDDVKALPGGQNTFRRVLLRHSKRKVGGFGEFYGPSEIELVQVLDRNPHTIFANRFWGDLGYIHLCFDIRNLSALRDEAEAMNFHFTVDSADSFDMGDAAGRFAYIEDPDGTLIELVETHKVPIFKPLNIFINLKKRHPTKPLPRWMIKLLRLHRVKS